MSVDMKPDPDVHRVARISFELSERIREDDLEEMFAELVGLCRNHPAKAAQVVMVLAAWLDPETPVRELWERVEGITQSRVKNVLRRQKAPAA